MTVPIVTGASGLTGRPRVRPVADEHDPEDPTPARPALPSGCLRRLSLPRDTGCPDDCEGRQRDGGCLCDIVHERGGGVVFEIDHEGFWCAT